MHYIAKKTVDAILGTGNHYLIQVKRNQPSLFDQIQEGIVSQKPLDSWQENEHDHGRHTQWDVSVYNALDAPKAKEWPKLKRFIHVHRTCYDTKKMTTSHADRFYITDLASTDASLYAKGVRGHWKIENSLHWVKDVIHGEDHNAIRKANGPINQSVISSMAINCHRVNRSWSIKDAKLKASANIREIICQLRT